jgi:type I restriction enzyme S subunit
MLKNDSLLNKLYSSAGGTKQANLSAQQLKDLNITFPQQPEQQKIADFLTSIDDLIAAQTQKIATLKTHKKGLMQQLFPSV